MLASARFGTLYRKAHVTTQLTEEVGCRLSLDSKGESVVGPADQHMKHRRVELGWAFNLNKP